MYLDRRSFSVSLYLQGAAGRVIIRIGRIIGYRGHRFAPGTKADGEKVLSRVQK
jgi:hypothetical protein